MKRDYTKTQKSNFVGYNQRRRKTKRSTRIETVEEYKARGGKVTYCCYSFPHYFVIPE